MNYEGYKRILQQKSKNLRITLVEWPGGHCSLEIKRKDPAGRCWSGVYASLGRGGVRQLRALLAKVT